MTDRPILFSGPMVLALLALRKTKTRRLIKPPHEGANLAGCTWRVCSGYRTTKADLPMMEAVRPTSYGATEIVVGPRRVPARVGDRLWVRERGHLLRYADGHRPDRGDTFADAGFRFFADGALVEARKFDTPLDEWVGDCVQINRPSIHMPRWASRLTLTVTAVRVERLQDITEEDARAEGVTADCDPFWRPSAADPDSGGHPSHRNSFEHLWGVIHDPDSWEANPWVSVTEFTVERKNIDA